MLRLLVIDDGFADKMMIITIIVKVGRYKRIGLTPYHHQLLTLLCQTFVWNFSENICNDNSQNSCHLKSLDWQFCDISSDFRFLQVARNHSQGSQLVRGRLPWQGRGGSHSKVSYRPPVQDFYKEFVPPPAGPSGIPGYPGIPGLISNPDPGILENLIPGFFGIYPIKQKSDFKDFYWVLTQICPKNPGMKMLG